jgi:SNF2 family DNA or RNA helicase
LYKGQQDFSDPDALIAESPKVQALIQILKEIRITRQKVLIFCDRRPMQTLLATVIEHVFKFRPTIINSLTGTGSLGSETSRAGLIREFEKEEGFNAIILSPMCAGVGLTITGANHVIHYGRWWNPAVENQATDRAYRIGQNLPVSVYHLIARDTTGRLPRSFDQILEELLVSKEALATDFLMGGQQCSRKRP